MKTSIKMLSILFAALLCLSSATLVFASGNGTGSGGDSSGGQVSTGGDGASQGDQSGQENTGNQGGASNNTSAGDESGKGDTLRDRTRLMDQSCISLKEKLSQLEVDCGQLEEQYQAALMLQNQSEASLLLEQLQLRKQERSQCSEELKQVREQLRECVRVSYTEEEMLRIRAIEMELKQKYPGDAILPVENIIPIGFAIKFDTPPVIRNGRTLVPVRALTEGLGAVVTWIGEESRVIVEKEGIKIELQLRNRIAYVNGEEITIDVPPETINNRTVVPLRFILQHLGYEVNWVDESEIIEITEITSTEG